ncbi:MAG: sensor histidine kinase [Clostridium sp.]|nr:sensor histidine kinase [Clostridium sp.]
MKEKQNRSKGKKTLHRQMQNLSIVLGIPFLVLLLIVFPMVYQFNREYATTLHNATTASEFNFDFKENLDLDMYYFVVGNKNVDHLPLEEVENARKVIKRLQKTTTSKENKWRVKSLLRLCDRLSECMVSIQNTKKYDSRMEQLEHDIYILTKLIQTYMGEYIHFEVKQLSEIQTSIQQRVMMMIGMVAGFCILIFAIMVVYSTRVSKNITEPVYQLCKKVETIGKGDFTVEVIKTDSVEMGKLDEGFNEMAVKIKQLLQREKDNQKALRKAEMELLQAQINPHFLYNTLDSIIWLAEAHQDNEVIQMTSNLSTFFRTSLSKGKDIISLESEKQQVESYLKIQQVRYSDILEYSIKISEKLMNFDIPKLTLQPLVENALYHGVKNKRGIGHIQVVGIDDDDYILLKVIDDGAGMKKEQLEALREGIYEDRHTGLGLLNVHNRLKLYYGEDYSITFESEFGEGSEITIRIPKKNE